MKKNKPILAERLKENMKEGLSLQEISWCETYLQTLSIKKACTEAVMSIKEAQDMLNKPSVNLFLLSRSEQHRIAAEKEREEELTREKIAGVLEGIVMDPTTKAELRLSALTKLNDMKQFDLREGINSETANQEEVRPSLTAEEAEALLEAMRNKNNKEK